MIDRLSDNPRPIPTLSTHAVLTSRVSESDGSTRPVTSTRPRVLARLLTATAHAITVIIAPAGFGKTTAILDLLTRHECSAHVRVPEGGSLQQFIYEFARRLSLPYPDISAELDGTQEAIGKSIERYAAWAIGHLRDVQMLIAIDDIHNADDDDRTLQLLIRLADATKANIHWIFSTRGAGKLPVARWLAYGDADALISADDLLVTQEDAEYLAKTLASPATPEDLERWIAQNHGFIVPIAYALRLSARRGSTAGVMDGTRAITFGFLAEELWSAVHPRHRVLLETAAFLPAIHIHAFENADHANATQDICQLAAEIVFLTINGDSIFSMHDLFRDFVRQQVLRQGPQIQQERYDGALDVLIKNAKIDDAFRLLVEIGDVQGLLEFGKTMSASISDPSVVQSVVDILRPVSPSNLPLSLLSLKAEHFSWFGEPREARYLAEEILRRGESSSLDLLCALRVMYRGIDFVNSDDHQAWLSRLPLIIARLEKGHATQAQAYQALSFSRTSGCSDKARDLIREIRSRMGELDSEARIAVNIAITSAYYYLADSAAALTSAREAASLAISTGDMRARTRTLNNLGIILFTAHDPEVQQLFDPLRDAVEQIGAWRFSHTSHWLPSLYHALHGNSEAAKSARLLNKLVIVSDDSEYERIAALRRHSENLGHLLDGNCQAIVSDYDRHELPRQTDTAYEISTDAAVAHVLLSDFGSSENVLRRASQLRDALSSVELDSVRHAVFTEIITLCAHGRWSAARRLHELIRGGPKNLAPLERALAIFCDGPPFAGLANAIESCTGRPFIGLAATLVRRIIENVETPAESSTPSSAEMDVLRLLALGKSNKEIAQSRTRSPETVKRQVAALYKKLGVENRTSAVAIARERGLLD